VADSHLCVLRWGFHSIPQNLHKLQFDLTVVSGGAGFDEKIDYNTEPLASILLDLLD
jgi:hypothetical protein